ncbi:MAG: bifunctional folylpolyglutamate synthase/dihydrofolate synthase [Ferruginibacter sp.]
MNYQQTLDYLYSQLPMFSRIGSAAYKKDLHNTITLCSSVGNPQNSYKTIHIAGTNGKGSTSHILAAILQKAGYKTGLYTSPHIKNFRERIRVNGKMITEQFIIDFTEKTKVITEEIKPSFFELTVAMAFKYFEEEKIDIAVIETGLGGLLDSTNIITPILSVITNIGYDHQNILGNTLPEIATQKAGIIKQNIPVVIGETLPETKNIFIETANKKNAPIQFAEKNFIAVYLAVEGDLLLCNVQNIQTGTTEKLRCGLTGLYQAKNLCTLLATVAELNKLQIIIPEMALHKGIEDVKKITGLRGRWEILQQHPTIIADVAHNKDGIAQVINQLNINYPKGNIHFILGFVKDKDVESVLKLFPPNASFYFTNAHIPRAMPCIELQQKAKQVGLKGECYTHVDDAVDVAKKNADENAVIMICGSFFILAESNLL